MNAEILAVGTELLMGEITNTDAQYLSERLAQMGIDVYRHSVVGDNHDRLFKALEEGFSRADMMIVSGGLGPTPDDLTKEVIAEYMEEPLVLDEESLERMKDYFKKSGHKMAESNIKQVMMPQNCIILPNDCGTAPGCIIQKNEKTVIMLPGPPSELKPMFENYVVPHLREMTEYIFYSKVYRLFGIGESAAAELLKDMMEKSTNPTVAPYAKTGEVRLRVTAKCTDEAEGEKIIAGTEHEIYDRVGKYIYSKNGKSLAETAVELLMEKGLTISTAESCTGGLAAKQITDIPGSSEVFKEGFVTYSNEAKTKYLGVKESTLKSHGAVSEETAKEMAEGLRKTTGADIAVSVTGIAGPGGGTEEKPVGLVYVGISVKAGTKVRKLNINGNRERIREVTCLNVFDMVRKTILETE